MYFSRAKEKPMLCFKHGFLLFGISGYVKIEIWTCASAVGVVAVATVYTLAVVLFRANEIEVLRPAHGCLAVVADILAVNGVVHQLLMAAVAECLFAILIVSAAFILVVCIDSLEMDVVNIHCVTS